MHVRSQEIEHTTLGIKTFRPWPPSGYHAVF
uniref:Uncharacterized protein n=1 Tax=Rhizophora mucronata TaxID=61149 RepID=A0A2P2IIF1_RHIMU